MEGKRSHSYAIEKMKEDEIKAVEKFVRKKGIGGGGSPCRRKKKRTKAKSQRFQGAEGWIFDWDPQAPKSRLRGQRDGRMVNRKWGGRNWSTSDKLRQRRGWERRKGLQKKKPGAARDRPSIREGGRFQEVKIKRGTRYYGNLTRRKYPKRRKDQT